MKVSNVSFSRMDEIAVGDEKSQKTVVYRRSGKKSLQKSKKTASLTAQHLQIHQAGTKNRHGPKNLALQIKGEFMKKIQQAFGAKIPTKKKSFLKHIFEIGWRLVTKNIRSLTGFGKIPLSMKMLFKEISSHKRFGYALIQKLKQAKNIRIRKSFGPLVGNQGQGLIEYLILVALMGVASIGIIRTLNQTVKSRFANAIYALQGKNQKAKTHSIKKEEYQRSDLSNFMSGSASADKKNKKK